MASSKRPPHHDDHYRDGQAPGNKSKRRRGNCLPPLFRTICDERKAESIWETFFRRVVRDEVTTAVKRHLCAGEQRPNHTGTCEGRQKTFRLRFKELPREIYTSKKVVAKDGSCLEVALYQCDAGVEESIVREGPLSCLEIELCVLQGNLGSKGWEDWTAQDFSASILRQTRKGGQLLAGNALIRLTNGVGSVTNHYVNDISRWARTGRFRLGARAKVARPSHDEANIREGISQAFRVKDIRGEAHQKHGIPSMDDKIWRLKGIAKDGKTHKLLDSIGIVTVGDFLHRLHTNPNQLKQVQNLGKIKNKRWQDLIRHASKADNQDVRQPYLSNGTLDWGHNTTTNACVVQNGANSHIYPPTQQPYLPPMGPIHLEQEHLVCGYENVQAGQGQPQHDFLTTHQGLFVPSTSSLHIGEGADMFEFEDNIFDTLDISLAADEVPNSAIYISSKGYGITIWRKIRNVFKVAFRSISRAKRNPKLVPHHSYALFG